MAETAEAMRELHVEGKIKTIGVSTCLWGARRPGQLAPVIEVMGGTLDANAMAEIDRILDETIQQPVGPQFMAPPARRPPT